MIVGERDCIVDFFLVVIWFFCTSIVSKVGVNAAKEIFAHSCEELVMWCNTRSSHGRAQGNMTTYDWDETNMACGG
jgi:hypothetical protein